MSTHSEMTGYQRGNGHHNGANGVNGANTGHPNYAQTAPNGQSAAANARAGIRLLLADDHRMLRESLRRSLSEMGFTVVGEARDGIEAVDMARSVRPHVVLMDITMPRLGGVEATRQVCQELPGTKVIALTMHADQDIVHKAIDAGATGYLIKDCSISEITQAIEAVVQGDTALSPALAASMLAEVRRRGEKKRPSRIVTAREEEVLQHIADGLSTPEVAEHMYISQKTVKNHLASIYQKLEARDRTQAVLQAVRMGIVSLN